jgi:hypothetical protein
VELPFLVLPVIALFLPQVFKNDRRSAIAVALVSIAYIGLGIQRGYIPLLEPAIGDWVTPFGMVYETGLSGEPPVLLHTAFRVFLTIASLGGFLGLALSFLQRRPNPAPATHSNISLRQLAVLLGPFTLVYTLFLIPRAASTGISDRYVLGLAVAFLILLVRYYQDRFQEQLPLATALLVGIMAIFGVIATYNTFSFYRARVALAAELRAAGIPDTSTDNGWEYNLDVELQHSDHINFPTIVVPPRAYVPVPPPSGPCTMFFYDYTPDIHALYGVSFDPNACYGPAPFAPVHYARWLTATPGTLYVVKYTK